MYVVKHVDCKTEVYFSQHEFEDFNQALNFMFENYKDMFGDEVKDVKYKFWDPINYDQSVEIFSIEMIAPYDNEGFYLYKDWEKIQ